MGSRLTELEEQAQLRRKRFHPPELLSVGSPGPPLASIYPVHAACSLARVGERPDG